MWWIQTTAAHGSCSVLLHTVIEADHQHFTHHRYELFKSLHVKLQSSCRASGVRGRILRRLNKVIYYLLISMKLSLPPPGAHVLTHVHCCVCWFISRTTQKLLNQYPQNLAEGWNQEPNEFGAETNKGAGSCSLCLKWTCWTFPPVSQWKIPI